MNWSDAYPDLPADDYPLNEARGCVYGAIFGALMWLCIGGALFGIGFLLAGIRIP